MVLLGPGGRWCLAGGNSSLGACFEGYLVPLPFSLSLLPRYHEMSSSAPLHSLCHCALPHHGPAVMCQVTMNRNLWTHQPKYVFTPFNFFLSDICHSDEKLTNTENCYWEVKSLLWLYLTMCFRRFVTGLQEEFRKVWKSGLKKS
jgi:hypothetical protein